MVGNADVAGKDSNEAQAFTYDREEDFKDWQRKRDKSQKMIGLLAWMIVMILATVAGFGIGFVCKITA